MLSITTDMKERQGLDSNKWYEAFVVENNDHEKHPDKMYLGRIQARIAVLFDGVEDKDLPWAIPHWNHCDGASPLSGVFSVPVKKSKVFIRFQDGNPAFPMYRGYHVDMLTQMEEIKLNYPERAVARFTNKAMMIVDTKDNVLYLRNPGNVKIYIDGNVEMEINGNVDELIHGSVYRRIKGDLTEIVDGDRRYHTEGDVVTTIEGDQTTYVAGSSLWLGDGSFMNFTSGAVQFQSPGAVTFEGSTIYENSSRQAPVPDKPEPPTRPTFEEWPGVPGSAKGTNERQPTTKQTAAEEAREYEPDSQPANVNGGVSVDDRVPFGSYNNPN